MQGSLQIANFFRVTSGGGLCVRFIRSAAGSQERKAVSSVQSAVVVHRQVTHGIVQRGSLAGELEASARSCSQLLGSRCQWCWQGVWLWRGTQGSQWRM